LIAARLLEAFAVSGACPAAAERFTGVLGGLAKTLSKPGVDPRVLVAMPTVVVLIAKNGGLKPETVLALWRQCRPSSRRGGVDYSELCQSILEVMKREDLDAALAALFNTGGPGLEPLLVGLAISRKADALVFQLVLARILECDFRNCGPDILLPLAETAWATRKTIVAGCRDMLKTRTSLPALHLLRLIADQPGFLKTDFDSSTLQNVQQRFVRADEPEHFLALFETLVKKKALVLQPAVALKLFKMRSWALLGEVIDSLGLKGFEGDAISAIREELGRETDIDISDSYTRFLGLFVCILNAANAKMYVRPRTGGNDYIAKSFPLLEEERLFTIACAGPSPAIEKQAEDALLSLYAFAEKPSAALECLFAKFSAASLDGERVLVLKLFHGVSERTDAKRPPDSLMPHHGRAADIKGVLPVYIQFSDLSDQDFQFMIRSSLAPPALLIGLAPFLVGPPSHYAIKYQGKVLAESSSLASHCIGYGARLNVIKKSAAQIEDSKSSALPKSTPQKFVDILLATFRDRHSPEF
jgi:hypothetical protein